jgi:hypothetical protein
MHNFMNQQLFDIFSDGAATASSMYLRRGGGNVLVDSCNLFLIALCKNNIGILLYIDDAI